MTPISTLIQQSEIFINNKKYTKALSTLNQCSNSYLSVEQKSQIYTLKGICKYQIKDEPRMHRSVAYKFSPKGNDESMPTFSQPQTHYKEALLFFSSALVHQPHYGKALFWKGKALRALHKPKKAYVCFAKSSKHGMHIKGKDLCIKMFNSEFSLPFKKVRDWITDNELIKENLQKKNAYLRYEALKSIQKIDIQHLSRVTKTAFSNLIKPLCPSSFYCCNIPGTGDNDPRVRKLAMKVMKLLDEDQF